MEFIDSSIWLAHLLEANPNTSNILKSPQGLFTSILTLFEVERKLLSINLDKAKILSSISFIERNSTIVNINKEIVHNASNLAVNHNLGAFDALIYSSSISLNAVLITADNDFRGLENVEIINK